MYKIAKFKNISFSLSSTIPKKHCNCLPNLLIKGKLPVNKYVSACDFSKWPGPPPPLLYFFTPSSNFLQHLFYTGLY